MVCVLITPNLILLTNNLRWLTRIDKKKKKKQGNVIIKGSGESGYIKDTHTMKLYALASMGPKTGKLPCSQHRGKCDLLNDSQRL